MSETKLEHQQYEFVDETKFSLESLAYIVKTGELELKAESNPRRKAEVEHMVQHATFEYWARRNRDGQS